ncbi:DUF3885 domain-containing protein [Mucilaginibacter sp. 14171R-50]|uniref:DUF3885 domain-containing protein n=1 Tax=Mucilaginibacter sp. 14171R-50 TaxID=2703789 RepID=UPI00138C2036|nr:DUF3885 domain-containing protein [Mucilaginibacter sp. 14171R-50]QHS56264.1 DUF3885 domain-containing protein [Mucilaginibacter sp. 14171R-50]
MKAIVKKTHEFLNENFPGLDFRIPLFYNWDNALRFDLEHEIDDDPDSVFYFSEVIKRAITLFEESFAPDDQAFFILRQYKLKRRKIRVGNYFFKQLSDFKKDDVNYYTTKSFSQPNEDLIDASNVALGKIKVSQLNYSNVLSAIALSYQPTVKSFERFSDINLPFQIFFINIEKKLIFHMYDNRGLDILGSNIDNIKPHYTKFNDWILDYDRMKINHIFE